MRVPVGHDRSRFVPAKLLVALGGVLLIAVATISVALAAESTKDYSVIDPPTSLTPGVAAAVGFELMNSGNSTHTLGSANIAVPSGFTVAPQTPAKLPVRLPDGKSWTATYSPASRAIELRAVSSRDAIAPGQSITATMTVTAPCSATTQRWTTEAKQANSFSGIPGNNFKLVPGKNHPLVTVDSTGGSATKLQFDEQPRLTQVGTRMTPDVTVKALDACDNPATGNVALRLSPNPSALSSTPQQLVSGVATFSELKINKAGEDYQLVASAGAGDLSSSALFDVVTRLCTSSEPVCEASDGNVTVLTERPGGADTMTLDFFGSKETPICEGYNSRGALARIEPDYSGTDLIAITMRWSKSMAPGTGVSNFVLCMKSNVGDYRIPPSCTKSGKLPSGEGDFCELKRSRNGVGELVISFLIHPHDPYVGLG
ncbi:MAG: hypothetical protein H0U05_11100 [Actinobacteria bacterium]|nr:hypothetical protein [Actinomycetota bacterium]